MIASLVIAASLSSFAPPVGYDYEPTQSYTVTELPADMMRVACRSGQFAQNRIPYGCTYRSTSQIFILESLRGSDYDIILRHEKAHLNGWDHR